MSASRIAPPPNARTPSCSTNAVSTAARSSARKYSSPCSKKTSATRWPATVSTSESVSRKVVPKRDATSRPTVLLPAPGGPTRTTSGAISAIRSRHDQRVEVAAHVAANLINRVTAELLDHRVGDEQRHHRFGDD